MDAPSAARRLFGQLCDPEQAVEDAFSLQALRRVRDVCEREGGQVQCLGRTSRQGRRGEDCGLGEGQADRAYLLRHAHARRRRWAR